MTKFLHLCPNILVLGAITASLSGCVAAIPMAMMAAGAGAVAVGGFAIYKTAQTASGGHVKIEFGSSNSKKSTPPKPLPPSSSVYVYGSGVRNRTFANGLQASGKFRSAMGGQDTNAVNLTNLNAGQVDDAMRSACRSRHPDLVFATINTGEHAQSNLLSFKHASSIQQLTLEAYDCRAQRVGWTEDMAVVDESRKHIPAAEIDAVAGQAMAERVLEAKALS